MYEAHYEPTDQDLKDYADSLKLRRCVKCNSVLSAGHEFFCCSSCRKEPIEKQTATVTAEVEDFAFLAFLDGRI